AIAAAASSIYGVVQLTGIDQIKWGRTSGYGSITRVFATMGHPNFLAAFLVMAFPVVAYFALRAFRERLYVIGAALTLTVILDTGMVAISISRGAWIALAVTVLVLAIGWALAASDMRLAGWLLGGTVVALVAVLVGLSTFPDGREVIASLKGRVEQ